MVGVALLRARLTLFDAMRQLIISSGLSKLPLCFQLLGSAPQAQPEGTTPSSSDAWFCPVCGGPMLVIERLTAVDIQLRSPPSLDAFAA